ERDGPARRDPAADRLTGYRLEALDLAQRGLVVLVAVKAQHRAQRVGALERVAIEQRQVIQRQVADEPPRRIAVRPRRPGPRGAGHAADRLDGRADVEREVRATL